jgi:hypothetical protein
MRAAYLAFALLALSACQRFPAATPLREEWHRIDLLGSPAGYLHLSERERDGGGREVTTLMKLRIARGSEPVLLESRTSVEEEAGGKVAAFSLEQKMSRQSTVVRGVVRGETLEVTTSMGGSERRSESLPFDPQAVGPRRAEETLKERLRRPGDELELVVFLPELLRSSRQRARLGGEEEVELPGGRSRLRRVTVEIDALPGAPIVHWVDEAFDTVKTALPFMGQSLETYRTTERDAVKALSSSPPEIFFSSAIRLARPLPRGAREVLYRLRLRESEEALAARLELELPAGAGQELVRRGEGVWDLRVRSLEPAAPRERPLAVDASLRPYLAPSGYLQSDDPRLAAKALEIAGAEKDSWRAARLLESWVGSRVRSNNLRTAFASAKEVFEDLEGDCTEFAVLLAAMARAAGIPSRLVAGLVYYEQSFVGHMWTEVYAGEWVPLDATRPQGRVDADHIALAVSPLDTTSIADLFLALLPWIGNLEIEVLEVER